MPDEKHEHKHYHFSVWPKMGGDAWVGVAMFMCIAFSIHSCFGG